MKRRNHIQRHPNQEDKTGKATFASTTSVNSSTVGHNPMTLDLPAGAKGDYKDEIAEEKENDQTLFIHDGKTIK